MQSNNPYNSPQVTGDRPVPHDATAASRTPADAPPSYDNATTSSQKASAYTHTSTQDQTLHVPSAGRASSEYSSEDDSEDHSSGIPAADRLSMDEERRELPPGWIREYDNA